MIDIDELQMRILGELEEAGVDSVAALINIVTNSSGMDEELFAFQSAIVGLIEARDVTCELSTRPAVRDRKILPHEEALRVARELSAFLQFKVSDRRWSFKDQRIAEIVLTAKGIAKAKAIIETRGHNWWRSTDPG